MIGTHTKINTLPVDLNREDHDFILRSFRIVSEAQDLRSATRGLIASLEGQAPGVAGAALFLCDEKSKRMVPQASQRFSGFPGRFQISQSLLRQSWRERTVVWCRLDQADWGPPQLICVMPINYASSASGLLHIEFIGVEQAQASDLVRSALVLLEFCAPVLELLKVRGGDNAAMLGMAQSINASIEAKDTYTSGHSERVARFTDVLAEAMGMESQQRQLLYVSALCHDVGKIGVSEHILRKPSLLSSEEYSEMQRHPTIGATIVKDLPGSNLILGGIKHHHERWDGTGYPSGLVGEAIPLFARIIAVTDAFDAMTSGRSYSGFVEQEKAVAHLTKCTDLFDPKILEVLYKTNEAGSLTTRTGTNAKRTIQSA
jgi:HD-GYP domain-containing protein (c-di-GMP phosphodiesterase class II)